MPPEEGPLRRSSGQASRQPRAGFLEANGLRLHYLEWGQRRLPPAVLLHATGFLARLWQPVAEALSLPAGRHGARFHLYAYDSRGHGDSDKPASDYHWRHFVDDLRGFLDALELRGVLAVGHSGGGAAAAYLAATHPQYVSRAVLIEPVVPPPGGEEAGTARRRELASRARRRRLVWSSPAELIRSYSQRSAFARWRGDVLRLYAEHGTSRRQDGRVQLKCPGEIEAQVFDNSASLDTWSLLPQVDCPTLVMRGEHTEPYMARSAQEVAARIPAARLVTIEGAGHLVPMERPEAVAAEIVSFVAEAPTP